MHVGVDGTPLLGRLTGIGWYTHDLLEAMARARPGWRFSARPVSWRTAGAAAVPPGVHLARRLAPARPLHAAWRRVPAPPLEALLRCDVFHGTNYVAPPAWRTPVVVTVHDLWFRSHPEHVPPAQRALVDLLPAVLRRASAVLTVSQAVADELAEWLPWTAPLTTAVPAAAHPRTGGPERPLALPPGAPFVLSLGTANARKNVVGALDALRTARSRGADVRLVVAGGVDDGVDLHGAAAARGLGPDEVVVLGYVRDGEVRWLLEHAEAMVSSSLHEGFGIPALEAMGAGCPVVAFAAGAVPEVVGPAGVLVPGADGGELGEALAALLHDDAARAALRAAGRERAAGYTWSSAAEQVLAVYEQVRG